MYQTSLYEVSNDAQEICNNLNYTYSLSEGQTRSLIFNYFNRFSATLEKLSFFLYEVIDKDLKKTETLLIATFVALILITLIAIFLFIIMISGINEQRESILFLFLEIPTEQVRMLHRNCDKFLQTAESIRELINKNEN
jgi:signal transduction histidine kinase